MGLITKGEGKKDAGASLEEVSKVLIGGPQESVGDEGQG